MKVKDIDFENVLVASGAQGFFGEGYWFHPYLRPFGLDFEGATFVAKTTTLLPRYGNMSLKPDFTPRDHFPDCIKIYPRRGLALNAVGLSGLGAKTLLDADLWQRRKKPFFLSFMAVKESLPERIDELKCFVALLAGHLSDFQAPIGLQINYSCPNTEHRTEIDQLLEEIHFGLSIASRLGIPLMPKLSILVPPKVAGEIAEHPDCDALCISNTIPFGELPDRILWKELFGSSSPKESPLARYGGGGLSGSLLLPILIEWLQKAKALHIKKPINAGGGILSLLDAINVFQAGADSIFLGSVAFLRPWRVKGIIAGVNGK